MDDGPAKGLPCSSTQTPSSAASQMPAKEIRGQSKSARSSAAHTRQAGIRRAIRNSGREWEGIVNRGDALAYYYWQRLQREHSAIPEKKIAALF